MSTPAIHATGLRKQFRQGDGTSVVAADDVDLTIHPGEIVAFLGPNGAGKTTTVDMLLGLTRPDAGAIAVYGTEPGAAVRAGRVSAVMQTGGLLNDFSVEETVRAIAALHGRADRVEAVLERARLTGIARRRVEACSGGEQQRLKFALALVPDPDLVILDEPTTGMDVASRQEFWQTMRADAAPGCTIVFATHYLAEADEFAERTVLMHRDRIVHDAGSRSRSRRGSYVLAGDGAGRGARDAVGSGNVAMYVMVSMAVAAVPVALIFAVGAATDARGDWTDWALAAAIGWLGSALFAIYGYAALARFPLTDGWLPVGGRDPLWLPVANVLAWTVIFSLLALWGVRRSRART